MTDELCPICLAPAPVNTDESREHLATHTRKELATVVGALTADLAAALQAYGRGEADQ